MGRSAHDLRVGERVGDYRIQRVLGRGGAGTVYEASGPSGAVALKVMHEHDPSGVGRKRFNREAALVQKLRHPHVVALLGFGYTDGGLPYILFELLHGRSLKSLLRRQGPMEVTAAAQVTLQVLDALVAAHAMGIIHRDIKPANIHVCDEDTPPELGPHFVKVLDFGLAKALEGEGAEVATITDTGYRLGTPRYMSPEMARGQGVGEAGDIYALGLVFAEMIAGRPVVQGTSQIDVLMAHANDKALPLGESVQQSPFASCIERAVAKRIEHRYPSAEAMRADVARLLDLHEQATMIAERFGDASADAETLMYDPSARADPLLSTDEMDPTPQMAPSTPAASTAASRPPRELAATVAFPEEFDASVLGLPDERRPETGPTPSRAAPTVPMHDGSSAPRFEPPTAKSDGNTKLMLALVVVLIVATSVFGLLLLR